MYYDIKEIKYKIKKRGGTFTSSYCGSVSFKRPSTEFEAKQQAEAWLKKKYPDGEIIDLKITFR
jgi:hypothetical protein